jgi:hypothetical protein
MMQTALATRRYTNKQIKPLLAPRLFEEYLPQSVSADSASREDGSMRKGRFSEDQIALALRQGGGRNASGGDPLLDERLFLHGALACNVYGELTPSVDQFSEARSLRAAV